MNKYIHSLILLTISLFHLSCQQDQQSDTLSGDVVRNSTKIEFDQTEHDFGNVIDGEIVSYNYKFENTGESDLLITSVNADCGCTVAEYPEDPVKPGETGYVKVQFNSSNRRGFNVKKATVLSNATPNKVDLIIKARVYGPDENIN